MSEVKMKWKATFEVRYDLDVIQRTDKDPNRASIRNGQNATITLTDEELEKLIKDYDYYNLSPAEQEKALYECSSEARKIIDALENDPRYERAAFKLKVPKPTVVLEYNGKEYVLDQEELEEYYKDPKKYMDNFNSEEHLRKLEAKSKLTAKQNQDDEYYRNNTYNRKYVSRSSDIKTIMLDEEDYQYVMDNIKKSKTYYIEAKEELSKASTTGAKYNFSSTSGLSDYSALLDSIEEEEDKLVKRLDMSITVLKNCDEDTKNYLEAILIDKIFSMDFNDKNEDGSLKPQWEVFEAAMDELLEEVQKELEADIEKLLEYGKNLWDFSKYVPSDFYNSDGKINPKYLGPDGKPNQLLLDSITAPDGVSEEDARSVVEAMVEMSDEYFMFNQNVYDGKYVVNLVNGKEYGWNPTTLARYFFEHPGLTISEFNDKLVAAGVPNVLYDGLLNGYLSENYPSIRSMMEKYAAAVNKVDEFQESLDCVKSMRKAIPYIKYTATDEYQAIYEEFRKAGYTTDGDVDVNKVLSVLGITGLNTEQMKYMTVNEMALYAYLKKYGKSNKESTILHDLHGSYTVGKATYQSDEYLESIQWNLDQRHAEYEAYQQVIRLLQDGKIDLGEKGIRTLDGFLDGIVQYGLNISRAFTTFAGARKTIDELKEEKIAQFLLTFRTGRGKDKNAGDISDNEWNYNYMRLNEMAFEYGEITESQYEALRLLYNYIINDDNAYGSISAYNSLYTNAKSFGNTLCTTSVAVLGKALSAVPGVGPVLDVLCRGINATEQFGKTVFKLYDPDSDDNNIGLIMTKGLFAAINSFYINKKFVNSGDLNFGRESVHDILLNTFYVETLKNMNITSQNILADIIFGEEITDSDISTYKLIKAIPEFMKKVTTGEITFEEGLLACIDLLSPYLISFSMKGKDFKSGGIKGAETELVEKGLKPLVDSVKKLQERNNRNRDKKR